MYVRYPYAVPQCTCVVNKWTLTGVISFSIDLWPRCLRSYREQPYVRVSRLRSWHLPDIRLSVKQGMTLYQGFIQLGAGLAVGLAGLAAGFAVGIVGDAGVRGTAQQPRLFVGMVRLTRVCICLRVLHTIDSHSHLRRSAGSVWPYRCTNNDVQRWQCNSQSFICHRVLFTQGLYLVISAKLGDDLRAG